MLIRLTDTLTVTAELNTNFIRMARRDALMRPSSIIMRPSSANRWRNLAALSALEVEGPVEEQSLEFQESHI